MRYSINWVDISKVNLQIIHLVYAMLKLIKMEEENSGVSGGSRLGIRFCNASVGTAANFNNLNLASGHTKLCIIV